MEQIAISIILAFCVVVGIWWWNSGGDAIAEASLKKTRMAWLVPGWPLLIAALSLIGLIIQRSLSWDYMFWATAGAFLCMLVLKAVVESPRIKFGTPQRPTYGKPAPIRIPLPPEQPAKNGRRPDNHNQIRRDVPSTNTQQIPAALAQDAIATQSQADILTAPDEVEEETATQSNGLAVPGEAEEDCIAVAELADIRERSVGESIEEDASISGYSNWQRNRILLAGGGIAVLLKIVYDLLHRRQA